MAGFLLALDGERAAPALDRDDLAPMRQRRGAPYARMDPLPKPAMTGAAV